MELMHLSDILLYFQHLYDICNNNLMSLCICQIQSYHCHSPIEKMHLSDILLSLLQSNGVNAFVRYTLVIVRVLWN